MKVLSTCLNLAKIFAVLAVTSTLLSSPTYAGDNIGEEMQSDIDDIKAFIEKRTSRVEENRKSPPPKETLELFTPQITAEEEKRKNLERIVGRIRRAEEVRSILLNDLE